MSNKTSLFRLLGCFIAALAVLVACSTGTDVGGQSHFACTADPDCAAHGAGLVCLQGECKSEPDAAIAQGSGGLSNSDAAAGGGGTGGVSGTSGAANTGGDTSTGGASTGTGGSTGGPLTDPILPPTPTDCPPLAPSIVTITALGQVVDVWIGTKRTDVKGPVMFYWHGTGGPPAEPTALLGPALQEVQDLGGIVAAIRGSTKTGTNTSQGDWYTGDFDVADYILGCAIQQLNIDTKRIFTAGCGSGGLQSGTMVYERSNYLAGAMPNSGGNVVVTQFQNPNHTPSLITAHGSCAKDMVILNFANESRHLCNAVSAAGGIAVDCEHGSGICGAPAELLTAQWQFLKDHPFGLTTDPYAGGLPASFPAGCTQYPLNPPPADCP